MKKAREGNSNRSVSAHSAQHSHLVAPRNGTPCQNLQVFAWSLPAPTGRGGGDSVLQEHAVCSGTLLWAPMGVTAATPRCPPGPGLWLLLESGRSSGSAALPGHEQVTKGGEEKVVLAARHRDFGPAAFGPPRTPRGVTGLTEAQPVLLLLECPRHLSSRAGKLLGLHETDLKMPQALTGRAKRRGHLVREDGRRGPSLQSL